MNDIRNLGKQKLEEAFEKTLKDITGSDYEVELEQVWMRGSWITVSFLTKKKEPERKTNAS